MATYQARVLVIANQTAGSPELVAALQARQQKGPVAPTLLMPAVRNGYAGKEETRERLDGRDRAVARGGARRRRRHRRPGPRGRGAGDLGPAQLRRGDRLDAARQHVEVAAVRPPPPRPADHRLRRPARRGRPRSASRTTARCPRRTATRSGCSGCARRRSAEPRSEHARVRPGRQLVHARLVRREPQADDPRLGDLVRPQPAAELRPRRGAQGVGGAGGELVGVLRQRAPVDDAAADDPERVAPRVRRSGAARARAASRRGSLA